MKKLLLSLILLPGIGISQTLPIKGCEDADCDRQKLQELLSGTEEALYDFYEFRYNDSINLEIELLGDSIAFTKSHSWVNEKAPTYYTQVQESEIDLARMVAGTRYKVIHIQRLPAGLEVDKTFDEVKFPVPAAAKEFNRKGREGAYQYFYDAYAHKMLEDENFTDMLEAEFIMKGGRLAAVKLINPPLEQRKAFRFLKNIKALENVYFESKAFKGCGDYKITFKRNGYNRQWEEERDEYLYKHYDYYIDNKLMSQLKRIAAEGDYQNGAIIDIDTSGSSVNFAFYHYLEARLGQEKLSKRWWRAVPLEEDLLVASEEEEEQEHRFDKVGKVPVYEDCDEDDSNKALQKCFQQGILKHVSENFKFPEVARQQGIQGRMYINFVVEKDGSIDHIKSLRGVDPLLDMEAIRTVSEIPDCEQPARIDDEPVRMTFTLPINAKLQ